MTKEELLAFIGRNPSTDRNTYRILDDHIEFDVESVGQTFTFLIDKDDEDLLQHRKWSLLRPNKKYPHVYAYVQLLLETGKRRSLPLHRVIVSAPKGSTVDHLNGNTLDNRKANLRITTSSGNAKNVQGKRGGKYPRGTWYSESSRSSFWFVQFTHNGSHKHRGPRVRYPTAKEAYQAYVDLKVQYGHYPNHASAPTFEDMCPEGFIDPLEPNYDK
jgi:hypothetical protein